MPVFSFEVAVYGLPLEKYSFCYPRCWYTICTVRSNSLFGIQTLFSRGKLNNATLTKSRTTVTIEENTHVTTITVALSSLTMLLRMQSKISLDIASLRLRELHPWPFADL